MTQGEQRAPDEVGAEAGFHPHNAGRQFLEGFFERQSFYLGAKGNLTVGTEADYVKYLLANVYTDRCQLRSFEVYLGLHGYFSCWCVLAFTG